MNAAETANAPHAAMDAQAEKAWIREAHGQVSDLFSHNAKLYWIDLLVTSLIGWSATVVYFTQPLGAWTQWLAALVAAVAFYRGGTFMHEIIHMPKEIGRAHV